MASTYSNDSTSVLLIGNSTSSNSTSSSALHDAVNSVIVILALVVLTLLSITCFLIGKGGKQATVDGAIGEGIDPNLVNPSYRARSVDTKRMIKKARHIPLATQDDLAFDDAKDVLSNSSSNEKMVIL